MSLDVVRRYCRTPKGMVLVILVGLTIVAALGEGWRAVGRELSAAVIAGMLIDAPILRWRKGRWVFPDGACLTGLIVGMILSPHEPWYVAAITAAIGVASKYVIRSHKANVFNPAALALVATFYLFDTGQSWWGALPELPSIALVLLIGSGVFIADRIKKMPSVLAFLGCYFTLVTLTAFAGDPRHVAALYRAPDLHLALFFAFFMVTDPPTSPPKPREQMYYGAITAVVGYAFYEIVGAAYFLLAGLLVANIWEAWRRARASNRHKREVADALTSEARLARS